MDLSTLDVPTARLVQIALRELGHYEGTTQGRPGPKTRAAYQSYLDSLSSPALGAIALPDLVARIAEGEVGVREAPRNSNRGPRVQEYQDADWLDGTGYAWCASFICWLVQQAERDIPLPFKRPRTAGAWDFERWAEREGLDMVKAPTPADIGRGDIVVFTFSHIGLAVDDPVSDRVVTIEGNTDQSGGREGGGVYRKVRRIGEIRSRIRLKLA